MEDENYFKFPSIIREKAKRGEFSFPEGTLFVYEPFQAYRGVVRDDDDFKEVSRDDFLSYAELGKHVRGMNEDDPSYFSASLSLNKASVENALRFPRKGWKIAVGKVYKEVGPVKINCETEHVDLWLYDGVEVEGFSIY